MFSFLFVVFNISCDCMVTIRYFVIIEVYFSCPLCREILWSWRFGVLKWMRSKCFCVGLLGVVAGDKQWHHVKAGFVVGHREAFWPVSRASSLLRFASWLASSLGTEMTFRRSMGPEQLTHSWERSSSNAAKDLLFSRGISCSLIKPTVSSYHMVLCGAPIWGNLPLLLFCPHYNGLECYLFPLFCVWRQISSPPVWSLSF